MVISAISLPFHPQDVELAFVLTGDRHLAEDLTQTALADAYRHWRKVTAARHPEAYVGRMLVNTHLSWRRRRRTTERPAELDEASGGVLADPGEAIAAREHSRALLAGLAPRPGRCWCCGSTPTSTTPRSPRRWVSPRAPRA